LWRVVKIGFLCIAFSSGCQSAPAPVPRSDWADVVLHATGTGPLNGSDSLVETRVLAIQAAKVDAYQKLEGEILQIKMDERQTVSDFIQKKPKLGEKVREYVRGARIVTTRVNVPQSVEVDADLFLGENFRAVLGLIDHKPSQGNGTAKNKDAAQFRQQNYH